MPFRGRSVPSVTPTPGSGTISRRPSPGGCRRRRCQAGPGGGLDVGVRENSLRTKTLLSREVWKWRRHRLSNNSFVSGTRRTRTAGGACPARRRGLGVPDLKTPQGRWRMSGLGAPSRKRGAGFRPSCPTRTARLACRPRVRATVADLCPRGRDACRLTPRVPLPGYLHEKIPEETPPRPPLAPSPPLQEKSGT